MLACFLIFTSPVHANPRSQTVNSGTGFFVSMAGDIITNHHVVEGCTEVMVRGAVPDSTAKVIAVDKQYDLALLRSNETTRRIATIRHDTTRLKEGEPVLVMGYPKESYKTKEYQIAESRVVGLRGPRAEPHWVQFADAAQQGNSGGPLLDSSGNVAGVIVGKSMLLRAMPGGQKDKIISQSDLAISLPVLRRFLNKHAVRYRLNGSYSYMMPKRLESFARAYIVNILCAQGA